MTGIKWLIEEDNITTGSYEKTQRIIEDYRLQHCCCPVCGSNSTRQTLVGFIPNRDHPENYVDANKVNCGNCGWSGIVHDLVPLKDSRQPDKQDKYET